MIFNEFLTPNGSDVVSTSRGVMGLELEINGARIGLFLARRPIFRASLGDRRRRSVLVSLSYINHLKPNGHYMGRTAQLTSRCCILDIYSTNICTEYFKHAA